MSGTQYHLSRPYLSGHDYLGLPSPTAGTRKRNRNNSRSLSSQPYAIDGSAYDSPRCTPISDARSPPPLANDEYELAGGTEGHDQGDYDDYFELEKQRRGQWSTPRGETMKPTTLDPRPDQSPSTRPWMLHQIFNLVGGVAGKLVQFCTVPFSGFQSGGGQKFDSDGHVSQAASERSMNDRLPTSQRPPLPGHFPSDSYYGVASLESLDDTPVRNSKRVRTGEQWVVVDHNGEADSRANSPRVSSRRTPGSHRFESPTLIPRPASRSEVRPNMPRRPSLIPVSRRTALDRKVHQESPKVVVKTHSSPRAYSRQSYGSPVLFPSQSTSPLPPESQRLINKIKREEMEDDARMRRMSAQTAAMLREARAALGSKFEVGGGSAMELDSSMEDGGW